MSADFEQIINNIFKETNPIMCEWDNLQYASKKGAIQTNFRFHTDIYKSAIQDKNNRVLFQGLINIKFTVAIIWVCFYLYSTKDFYFLLTIPVSILFSLAVEYLWYRRLIITVFFIAATIFIGKYFDLNYHYYYFIIFVVVISSWIHSVYNTFLTQFYYSDKNYFVAGINQFLISGIYDHMKGIKHTRPFI